MLALVRAKPRDLFLDHQLLLFQLRNFEVISRWATLKYLNRVREGLVFLLQFLQM